MKNSSRTQYAASLRDLWAELELGAAERAGISGAALSSGRAVSSAPASSGSGSGGLGYGLGLIAPDPFSRQRIMRIMQALCEKDAERNRQ